MNVSCIRTVWNHNFTDNKRCEGELEVVVEEVDDGDGVWAQSGLAFFLPEGEDGYVHCSEGCRLHKWEIEKIEKAAAEDYYNGTPPGI